MDRPERGRRIDNLPAEVRTACGRMAADIRSGNHPVREDRIREAKTRLVSGYYNTDRVARLIASRLLETDLLW